MIFRVITTLTSDSTRIDGIDSRTVRLGDARPPKVLDRTGEVEGKSAPSLHWFNAARLHFSIRYTSPIDYENSDRRNCLTTASGRRVD